ncbi:MAG: serine hydrolase [Fimbriimonadaceae bacterium]|nr:serine hydrolase [Fimbriimonadaceae bacterium]
MLGLVAAVVAVPPTGRVDAQLDRLQRVLNARCAAFRGRAGYCLVRLDTGATISFRGDERFPTASTIKTAAALHAIREVDAGRRKWDDKYPLPNADARREWDASEWSYYMKDGLQLNLDGYVNLMITVSDNLATRVIREWLGTVAINRSLDALGLTETRMLASAPPEETRLRRLGGQFGMGVTTPRDMARLLTLVYRNKAASPAGCERLVRILSHQYWDDWIGASIPPGTCAALKSGAISRSRSDTAIVYAPVPYVLTIYTDAQKDRRWEVDNEGDVLIRAMAVDVWNGLQRRKYVPPKGYEKFLPTGAGVENT